MRLRDLEALLVAAGWRMEPRRGGVGVVWKHEESGRLLTYHAPHGTDATEVPKAMARDVMRKVGQLEGQAR